jgi:hypothetical protein
MKPYTAAAILITLATPQQPYYQRKRGRRRRDA